MPISATGNRAERGFTLVELMVVLTLIGLMTTAVLLLMPDPRGRLLDEGQRFAARSLAARDLAIVTARPVRLRADATGYAFDQRRSGRWVAIAEKPFRPEPWGKDVVAGPAAAIVFDSSGVVEPQAQFVLQRDGERLTVSIAGDGGIRVGG